MANPPPNCDTMSYDMVATTDACKDAADQAVWNKDGKADFESDLSACGHQCLGGASCTSTCIAKRRGYTEACADCFGALTGCTKDNCMFDCMMDADGSSCKNCVDGHCTPAIQQLTHGAHGRRVRRCR